MCSGRLNRLKPKACSTTIHDKQFSTEAIGCSGDLNGRRRRAVRRVRNRSRYFSSALPDEQHRKACRLPIQFRKRALGLKLDGKFDRSLFACIFQKRGNTRTVSSELESIQHGDADFLSIGWSKWTNGEHIVWPGYDCSTFDAADAGESKRHVERNPRKYGPIVGLYPWHPQFTATTTTTTNQCWRWDCHGLTRSASFRHRPWLVASAICTSHDRDIECANGWLTRTVNHWHSTKRCRWIIDLFL